MVYLSSALLMVAVFYRYYIARDFPFLVQSGDTVYEIRASDFDKCSDETCQIECETGTISCIDIAIERSNL